MREILAWAAILAVFPSLPATAEDFSRHWHDGRAELDGYTLRISRYGEERTGEAVMIFVTEPFSESKRVKVEDPSRNPSDSFDALKLNLVRDFQTGIYDYNTMVSVFTRSSDFSPVKVSFSSAEWCGHVYDELVFRDDGIHEKRFSYFEDESGTSTLPLRAGVSEDNLYIVLRGLRGAYLEPGEKRRVTFLPSLFHARLAHQPLAWQSAEVERRAGTERVVVPAGTFSTYLYVVRTPHREGRFHVEAAYPHRIVRWTWRRDAETSRARPTGDETGELTGTARLSYWKLNGNGNEHYREQIGLVTRGAGARRGSP